MKMSLGRPRPEAGDVLHQFLTLEPLFHSLPSGHTAEIMGSCLPLALLWRRYGLSLLLGLVVAAMGFTRMYLYQHYPSDVFFGLGFGALAGLTTYVVWDHIRRGSGPCAPGEASHVQGA